MGVLYTVCYEYSFLNTHTYTESIISLFKQTPSTNNPRYWHWKSWALMILCTLILWTVSKESSVVLLLDLFLFNVVFFNMQMSFHRLTHNTLLCTFFFFLVHCLFLYLSSPCPWNINESTRGTKLPWRIGWWGGHDRVRTTNGCK